MADDVYVSQMPKRIEDMRKITSDSDTRKINYNFHFEKLYERICKKLESGSCILSSNSVTVYTFIKDNMSIWKYPLSNILCGSNTYNN